MSRLLLVALAVFPTLIVSSCIEIPHDRISYSADCNEARFNASGTLSFEKSSSRTLAHLHSLGRREAISLDWPVSAPPPKTIDPAKRYEVEYLEATIKTSPSTPDWVDRTLLRLGSDGMLIFDGSVCAVHDLAMKRQLENGVGGGIRRPFLKKCRRKHFQMMAKPTYSADPESDT